MIDSKILGNRIRMIRCRLGLTQKQLAEATFLSQSAMSRLENGEEVYASVLLAILYYFQGKINLDYLFSQDFNIESESLLYHSQNGSRQSVIHQLSMIAESLQTGLDQVALLQKKMQ